MTEPLRLVPFGADRNTLAALLNNHPDWTWRGTANDGLYHLYGHERFAEADDDAMVFLPALDRSARRDVQDKLDKAAGIVNAIELGLHPTTPREAIERLTAIARLLSPCSPPTAWPHGATGHQVISKLVRDVTRCPAHPSATWPCTATKAAWHARGLIPAVEAARIMNSLPTFIL
ncbi:hypothetical protein [Microbispora sp. NBRC 16548]|uniref:hypothetical protein n=1 Tax=Microbispora sp. NBRC 16548 TaxID=3030994 RepID=UPI0024A023D0|nr:hypothetical protein [Microbispora sp. NBRC 16548]GLX06709.1 hypothetical protein Misp03_36360 [Microbispora sp. NBRC 16548]